MDPYISASKWLPGSHSLTSDTKNNEWQSCYSDGYQPFNYNSRLKQSKPAWVEAAEATLAKKFSESGINLLPLLTGYRGTEKGLKQVNEISVKTCTNAESQELSKNRQLLAVITDFLNLYQAGSHPTSPEDLHVFFETDRKNTVFSSLKSNGNGDFDKPTN